MLDKSGKKYRKIAHFTARAATMVCGTRVLALLNPGSRRKSRYRLAVTAALAASALILAAPAAAQASTPKSQPPGLSAHPSPVSSSAVWYMQDLFTNFCIDDSRAYGLRAVRCTDLAYQQWYLNYRGGIHYQFQNVLTRLCLDDSRAYGLRAVRCTGYNYQTWKVIPDFARQNGYYYIENDHTSLCLDDSLRYGLRAVRCNFSKFQLWI